MTAREAINELMLTGDGSDLTFEQVTQTIEHLETRLRKLREKFPAEAVGHMPRGGTQLDYVGHAAVTDRLLTVDPFWDWEPMALDDAGLPAMRVVGNDAVLWIRLTVLGVTRLGVGTAPKDSFELHKQLIGDAIRNAAMRFGVALDLWTRDELESQVALAAPDPAAALVERLHAATSQWAKDDARRQVMREQAKLQGWPDTIGGYSPDQIEAAALLAERLNDDEDPFLESASSQDPLGSADAPHEPSTAAGEADEQDPDSVSQLSLSGSVNDKEAPDA